MKGIVFCDNSLRELLNFREDIINSYAKEGYAVYLISPQNRDYTPLYKNITYIPIKMSRGGMNPFKDLYYMFSLIRIYHRIKPVFIFHYTVKPNIYGSFAARFLRIPSASMIAGLGYLFSKTGVKAKIGRFLYKLAMKFPKKIFVLNEMNRNIVLERGLAKEKQLVFLTGGEGINLEKFK